METLLTSIITMKSPEDHLRLRSVVQKSFSPKSVAEYGDRIKAQVDHSISYAKDAGQIDFVKEFAEVIPSHAVLKLLLGVPEADHKTLLEWMFAVLSGYLPGSADSVKQNAEDAAQGILDYVRTALDERQRNPGPDLLSSLVSSQQTWNKVSRDEMVGVASHLFLAGVESTVALLGNSMHLLLQNPDQVVSLRHNPDLVGPALEEILRLRPPVRVLPMRYALEDIKLNDITIFAGDEISIWSGSANRDPAAFTNAHQFDLARQGNAHLSFSTGMNFCLGAHLARLEARTSITSWLASTDSIELVSNEATYRESTILDSLATLPILVR